MNIRQKGEAIRITMDDSGRNTGMKFFFRWVVSPFAAFAIYSVFEALIVADAKRTTMLIFGGLAAILWIRLVEGGS